MSVHQRYLTSVFRAFSTFGERRHANQSVVELSEQLLNKYLQAKNDFTVWSLEEVEQAFDKQFDNQPNFVAAKSLVLDFIRVFPPHQATVFLHEFLLALKADHCSPSTIRNYRSDISQFLSFTNKTAVTDALVKPKLLNFIRVQRNKGLRDSSVERKLKTLNQFEQWLFREGIVNSHVLENYKALLSQNQVEVNPIAVSAPVTSLPQPQTTLPIYFSPEQTRTKQIKSWQETRSRWHSTIHELRSQLNKRSKQTLLGYLNLALVLIFFLGVTSLGFIQFFGNVPQEFAYPQSLVTPNRTLSFQGRLTDQALTPITTATDVTFTLWDANSLGNQLWTSGTCNVDPDQDGIFAVELGGNPCGTAITEDVFSENSNVWLEVVVEGETLTPRQKIKTVPYALNTETVQGYPIAASAAATRHSLVVMDGSGQVVLAEVSPTLRSTAGTFAIEGQTISIQTTAGGNGDIVLDPAGLGEVTSLAFFEAPGATLSATYAGSRPLTVNGATTAEQVRIAYDPSNYTTFRTDATGDLTITPSGADTTIAGDLIIGSSGTTTFNSLEYAWPGSRTDGYVLQHVSGGTLAWADPAALAGTSTFWLQNNGTLYPKNSTVDVLLGGQASTSAKFAFLNNNSGTPTASISGSVAGNGLSITGDGTIATTLNRSLILNPNGGNVGIGTTSPTNLLHVAGNARITGDLIMPSGSIGRITGNGSNELWFGTGAGITFVPYQSGSSINMSVANGRSFAIVDSTGGNNLFGINATSAVVNSAQLDFDFRIASDTLTNAFFVDGTTGSIGIGTSSPLATLDVRHNSGTVSVASVSGRTSFAALVADNSGSGDIFTASSSGLNRFVITQGGNVGIGTTSPAALLELSSSGDGSERFRITRTGAGAGYYLSLSDRTVVMNRATGSTAGLDLSTVTSGSWGTGGGYISLSPNNTEAMRLLTNGNIGIGSSSPDTTGGGTTYTKVVEIESTGNPVLRLDHSDAGTSSEVGIVSFGRLSDALLEIAGITDGAIDAGYLSFRTQATGGSITERMRLTSAGDLQLNAQNDLRLADSDSSAYVAIQSPATLAGSYTLTLPDDDGGSGQVLSTDGSGVLSWTTVATLSNVLWYQNNGALYPANSTVDMLVGGQATASAKFAFINVNSGTPTASIAGSVVGNALSITGDGTIATTLNRSLILNPNGGNVGIGTTAPSSQLDIVSNTSVTNRGLNTAQYTTDAAAALINFTKGRGTSTSPTTVANSDYVGSFVFRPYVTTTGIISTAFFGARVNGTVTGTSAPTDLFFATSGGSNDSDPYSSNHIRMVISAAGNVGIGTTSPLAKLDVNGEIKANAATIAATYAGSVPLTVQAGPSASGNALVIRDSSSNIFASFGAIDGTNEGHIALSAPAGQGAGAGIDFSSSGGTNTGLIQLDSVGNMVLRQGAAGSMYFDYNNGVNFRQGGSTTTVTLDGSGNTTLNAQADLRLADADSSAYAAIQAPATIGANYTLTLPDTDGDASQVLTTDGSGVLTWTTPAAAGTNYWTQTNGALYPGNSTVDVLFGGVASASANFAFLNNNSGTPTASISGNIVLNSVGTIQTTNNRALTIGGNTTGDIEISPRNGDGLVHISGDGTTGRVLQLIGDARNWSIIQGGSLSAGGGSFSIRDDYENVNRLEFDEGGVSRFRGNSLTTGEVIRVLGADRNYAIAQGGTYAPSGGIGIRDLFNNATRFVIDQNGLVGIGTTGPDSFLHVLDGSAGSVSAVAGTVGTFENDGNGYISLLTPDASERGILFGEASSNVAGGIIYNTGSFADGMEFRTNGNTVRLSIDSAGNSQIHSQGDLRLADADSSAYAAIQSPATLGGSYTLTLPDDDGAAGQVLSTDGSGVLSWATTATLANIYWYQGNGALYPANSTVDMLVGGQATSSAKFAFINVNSGTPTASIAGSVAGNGLTIDGDGTIATTLNRSLILNPNGGNVGIGTTAALAKLELRSSAANTDVQRWVAADGSRLGRFTETSGGAGWFEVDDSSGNARFLVRGDGGDSYLNGSTQFGLGTTAPIAQLDVNGELITNAATISATYAGSRPLHVLGATTAEQIRVSYNTANYATMTVNSSGQLTLGSTGNLVLDPTSTINLPDYTGSGAGCTALETDTSGNLVCGADDAYWRIAAGALSPINNTLDILVGSTATASAKFAVLNVNNGGTPVASVSTGVSGTAAYLSANGSLQSVNNAALTIGGNTTGHILLQPTNGTGLVGIGTTAPWQKFSVLGATGGTTAMSIRNTTSAGQTEVQAFNDTSTNDGDRIAMGVGGTTASNYQNAGFLLTGANLTSLSIQATNASAPINFATGGSTTQITIDANGNLVFANGNTLAVGGAAVTAYNFFADSTAGSGIAASDNDLYVEDDFEVDGTVRFGNLDYTFPTSQTANYVLQTNGSGTLTWADPVGTGFGLWNQAAGAAYLRNTTTDMLVGGTSTASAKFAVLNVANGGTPVASISSGTSGTAAYLSANGSLQSANLQSLTLGGTTTGNIILAPTGQSSKIGVGTTAAPIHQVHVDGRVTGKALFGLNETGDQDIFVASASGATRFRVARDGYIYSERYADLANNAYFLDPAATGTSLTVAGNVGIGTSSPSWQLDQRNTYTNASGTVYGGYREFTLAPAANTSMNFISQYNHNYIDGATTGNFTGTLYAIQNLMEHQGSGTITAAYGEDTTITNSGPITTAISGRFGLSPNANITAGTSLQSVFTGTAGTVGTYRGLDVSVALNGGTMTNTYGVYVGDITTGTQTNRPYGLYVADVNTRNSFEGLLGVGVASPRASFDLRKVLDGSSDAQPVATISGATSLASVIIDQSGTGSIFTASRSGQTRFVITNDGRVGINTTNPTANLTIQSANTNDIILNFNNANNQATNNFIQNAGNNQTMVYRTGNGSTFAYGHRFHVNSDTATFNINGDGSAGVNTPIASVANLATFDVRASTLSTFGTAAIASISGRSTFAGLVVDNSGSGDVFTASSSGLNRFVIKQGGNVGIGTSNPVQLLQLGNFTQTSTATPVTLTLGGTYSNTAGTNSKLRIFDSGTGSYGGFGVSTNQLDYHVWSSSIDHVFYQGTTELFRIQGDSDVGIGGAPGSTQLYVHQPNATGFGAEGFSVDSDTIASVLMAFTTDDAVSASEYFAIYRSEEDSTPDNEFLFRTDGTAHADGTFSGGGADVAEMFKVMGNAQEGDLVSVLTGSVAKPGKTVQKSTGQSYDQTVLGVVSTNPGLVAGYGDAEGNLVQDFQPVALAGRVPVKVSTENGVIRAGDFLTSSSQPGVAMKATQAGRVIGVAMEDYDGSVAKSAGVIKVEQERLDLSPENQPLPNPQPGTGKIMVFVNTTYHDPAIAITNTGDVQIAADQSESNLVATPTYTATLGGNLVSKVDAFAQLAVANLKAGFISARQIVAEVRIKTPEVRTEVLSPITDDLTVALPNQNSEFKVTNNANEVVAQIDDQGNTTLLGNLVAQDVTVQDVNAQDITAATISAPTVEAQEVDANSARLDYLTGKVAELEHIKAQTAELATATISGTLYANDIAGFQDKVAASLQEPSLLEQLMGTQNQASESASVARLFNVVDSAGFTASGAADLNKSVADLNLTDADVSLGASAVFINNYFEVNGSGYIADSLGVQNKIVVGDGLTIGNGWIESKVNNNTLAIQPSGQGKVEFLAGAMTIQDNGLVNITGDLQVAGSITAQESLFTNLLAPTDFSKPFQIQVAGVNTETQQVDESKLEIINAFGTPVATISAQGRASFSGLDIDHQDVSASGSSEVNADKTSGKALVSTGTNEVTIVNAQVKAGSLIYVTPLGSTGNQSLYVKAQQDGRFTAGFDQPVAANVQFNWWIVN